MYLHAHRFVQMAMTLDHVPPNIATLWAIHHAHPAVIPRRVRADPQDPAHLGW